MNEKTCFFIGNRNTPSSIEQQLIEVVEQHITQYGVTIFTVGHYGSFDSLVTRVLKKTKKQNKKNRSQVKKILFYLVVSNKPSIFALAFGKEVSS